MRQSPLFSFLRFFKNEAGERNPSNNITRVTHYRVFEISRLDISFFDDTPGVLLCINVFFFAHRHFFLFRPRVISRALGSGPRREPARTPRRKCGPWPRSVARALGVQSLENWQVTTGSHSACKAMQAHSNPRTG